MNELPTSGVFVISAPLAPPDTFSFTTPLVAERICDFNVGDSYQLNFEGMRASATLTEYALNFGYPNGEMQFTFKLTELKKSPALSVEIIEDEVK